MAIGIKQLQDFLAPRLERLEGKIEALDAKVTFLDKRIDERIESLRNEILSIRNELLAEIRSIESRIDTAIDVHERLAAVEAKLGR